MQTIKQTILTMIICLAMVAGVGLASASVWTGPTATPPNSNTPAPINVSGTTQTFSASKMFNMKSDGTGIFTIAGGLWTKGIAVFDGSVGIGTAAPTTKLQIGNDAGGNSHYITLGKGYDSSSGINWQRASVVDSSIYSDTGENLLFETDMTNTIGGGSFIFRSNGGSELVKITTSGDIVGTEGFSISNNATNVYDDATTSDSPYSRVNADSFHTNGIGVGNMYIEGSAIDANTTINIGAGKSGGQPVQNVFFGGQIKIAGGLPGANKVLTSDANGLATWQTPSAGAIYTAGTGISISGTVITNTGIIAETDPKVFAWAKAADDSKYLNTTATTQYKSGALGVGGVLTADSNAIFAGNVGIGTNSPTSKLTVYGNITLLRPSGSVYSPGHEITLQSWSTNTDTVHDAWVQGSGTDTCNGDIVKIYSCPAASGGTKCVDVTELGGAGTGIYFKSNVTCVAGTDSYSLRTDSGTLQFLNTAGTAKMVLGQDGYVGIGTTAPGAKLEVAGQVKITGGSPGANKVLTSDANGLATWQTPTSGIGGSGTANYLSKWTAGSSLGNSIIYDNGNVGIGTAAPSSKLQIGLDTGGNSNYLTLGKGWDSDSGIQWSRGGIIDTSIHSNGSEDFVFETDLTNTISGGNFIFKSNGSTELARITTTGNVGIGTTDPGYRLHLAADGAANLALDRASADGGGNSIFGFKSRGTQAAPGIVTAGDDLLHLRGYGYDGASNLEAARITMDTEGTVASTQMPGRIMFYTATNATPSVVTEQMRINSAGNVGIGTASPGAKLEVAGQVKITGGSPGANKVLTSDANGLATWQTPTSGIGGSGTANYLSKWTAGSSLGNSIIYDNGTNVGIGTTAPGTNKLQVNGKI